MIPPNMKHLESPFQKTLHCSSLSKVFQVNFTQEAKPEPDTGEDYSGYLPTTEAPRDEKRSILRVPYFLSFFIFQCRLLHDNGLEDDQINRATAATSGAEKGARGDTMGGIIGMAIIINALVV